MVFGWGKKKSQKQEPDIAPQKKQIDYVNWIELIKFNETRNYVQRVLENINVYNYMLSKKPVKMINFFKDYPSF